MASRAPTMNRPRSTRHSPSPGYGAQIPSATNRSLPCTADWRINAFPPKCGRRTMLARFRARSRTLALSLGFAATTLVAGLGFAGSAQAQSDEGPLARFEDPICPGVVGLKLEAAAEMVERIRANAAQFGRNLAPDGACTANLVVAFVDDGLAFARRMQR